MSRHDGEKKPLLEVYRIGWNWYRYHVISPPDVDVMGHGTKRFVRLNVNEALIRAGAEFGTAEQASQVQTRERPA
jgi:hypothetical protein